MHLTENKPRILMKRSKTLLTRKEAVLKNKRNALLIEKIQQRQKNK